MKNRPVINLPQALIAGCLMFVLATPLIAAPVEKPNILIMVADDLGYADLGVQGCTDIPTPNLD